MADIDNHNRWQEAVFVNCPHCGEVMQVICPQVNTEVSAVLADPNPPSEDMEFDALTTLVCQNTKQTFFVRWHYWPEF